MMPQGISFTIPTVLLGLFHTPSQPLWSARRPPDKRDGDMTRMIWNLLLSTPLPLPPAAETADLFRLALTGWTPSAGTGLEALFDRMEAGR
jgi:hypothetical protein